MKQCAWIILVVMVASVCFTSCKKSPIIKPKSPVVPKNDTSTTLIANQSIVGNWRLVTDSLSTSSIDTVYNGTPDDRYIFTIYGNMFIKSGFNQFIDTAIYTISPENRIDWTNSYVSQQGYVVKGTTYTGYYSIISVTTNSLVLYQKVIYPEIGLRVEQLRLEK